MIEFKNHEPEKKPGKFRIWHLVPILLLILCGLICIEKWRGESALEQWRAGKAAKGETYEAAEFLPACSPEAVKFTGDLKTALDKLPKTMWNYGGQLLVFVPDGPGKWRRGSQVAQPVSWSWSGNPKPTWEGFAAVMQQAEPGLRELRQLLANVPTGMDYDAIKAMASNSVIPNLVNLRLGSQALEGAALCDLHKGNLAEAVENLTALEELLRYRSDDPGLVALMVRSAVANLSAEITWDALQAEDWTDAQLARLQSVHYDSARFLAQLPRAFQAEMIARINLLHRYKSEGLQTSLDRAEEMARQWGGSNPPVPAWRKWVFHPLWRAAWAEQEEMDYLKYADRELGAVKAALQHHSKEKLAAKLTSIRDAYQRPQAAWRFYGKLPGYETVDYGAPTIDSPPEACPYLDLRRAANVTMANLTRRELVSAAVAIKRYHLKHGTWPANLEDLTPEFLASVPIDYMDGKPLRYRRNPDNTWTLYSVGENFKDDGGNPLAKSAVSGREVDSPWRGADWVWPQAKTGQLETQFLKTGLPGAGK